MRADVAIWFRHRRDAMLAAFATDPGIRCHVVSNPTELGACIGACSAIVMAGSDYAPEVARLVREAAPKLRMIQLFTAGYDRVEANGVPPHIVLANAGECWSPAVAEHAITTMLALYRQLPAAFDAQRRHAWTFGELGPRMRSPRGHALVIVGYGSIGREAAMRARAFGMRVIGVSRSARRDEHVDEAVPVTALDAALARADVVLIAAPSTPETVGLMNAARFAACRPGAILVNIARGNLVERDALLDALRSGRLAAAALDVMVPEPLAPDDPLWDEPNVLITPHVAGFEGPEGIDRLGGYVAQNVLRLLRGEAPLSVVKPRG